MTQLDHFHHLLIAVAVEYNTCELQNHGRDHIKSVGHRILPIAEGGNRRAQKLHSGNVYLKPWTTASTMLINTPDEVIA